MHPVSLLNTAAYLADINLKIIPQKQSLLGDAGHPTTERQVWGSYWQPVNGFVTLPPPAKFTQGSFFDVRGNRNLPVCKPDKLFSQVVAATRFPTRSKDVKSLDITKFAGEYWPAIEDAFWGIADLRSVFTQRSEWETKPPVLAASLQRYTTGI